MKTTADYFHSRRALIYAEKHATDVCDGIAENVGPGEEFATFFIGAVTIFAANMLAKSAMAAADCDKPRARELIRASLKNMPRITEEMLAVLEVKPE